MEEKTYKLLGGSGALNIAVGAVVLVSGIASGVLLIVNGARQLAHRGKLGRQIEGVIGTGKGHHGDLVAGIAGRLVAVNALAGGHQERLVIAKRHHQVAFA